MTTNTTDRWLRAEFALVVGLAFGYSMYANVRSLFHPPGQATLTEASLQFVIVSELVLLSLIGAFLYWRGRRFARISTPPARRDIGAGIGLAVGAYLAYYLLVIAAVVTGVLDFTSVQASSFIESNITLGTLLLVSIVNPVFEETLLCGYIVTVLKERRGFWMAVNVSLAIRITCHLYQGAAGIVGIIPLGLVFTFWFARTGRLWPVVLAHAIFDVVGLWPFLAK